MPPPIGVVSGPLMLTTYSLSASMERTIGAKKVTYDFERMMDGADLVSCSGFADEMIKRM